MKIQLVTKPLTEISSDYLVLPIFEGEKTDYGLSVVASFLKENPKFGKLFESQLIYTPSQKILLLGAGKKEKLNFAALQNWFGAVAKALAKKTKQLTVLAPTTDKFSAESVGQALAIGIELGVYDPTKEYKSESEPTKLTNLEVIVERAERGYQEGLKAGQIIAEAINMVRRLGDMPSNEMTPTYFLNVAKKIARENKLKLTVLDERQAKKKGMGAFVGVAQGSNEPSYMIAMEYKGDIKSREKWGLVGKGITFDSGGISIKPSQGMHEMKYDMMGAATVLGTLLALTKLDVKTNAVGIMALTENMP